MRKKKVAIFVDWENVRKGIFHTAYNTLLKKPMMQILLEKFLLILFSHDQHYSGDYQKGEEHLSFEKF